MAESSASALEPYLLLARSTKGASAAKVISDATSAPGVYNFGELLDLPNIQQLKADNDGGKAYALLELFAYGTLQDYTASKDLYPALSPFQLVKLKHLTLVSLALQHRSLKYETLLSALQVDSIRELEDLIIDVIYANLLAGKMHHQEKVLHVDSVPSRDVKLEDLGAIKQGLQNWCTTALSLVAALDDQILATRQSAQSDQDAQVAYNLHRDAAFRSIMQEEAKPSERGIVGASAFRRAKMVGDEEPEGIVGASAFRRAKMVGDEETEMNARGGRGGFGGEGRLLGTRSVQLPDELSALRSPKRQRERAE